MRIEWSFDVWDNSCTIFSGAAHRTTTPRTNVPTCQQPNALCCNHLPENKSHASPTRWRPSLRPLVWFRCRVCLVSGLIILSLPTKSTEDSRKCKRQGCQAFAFGMAVPSTEIMIRQVPSFVLGHADDVGRYAFCPYFARTRVVSTTVRISLYGYYSSAYNAGTPRVGVGVALRPL